MPFKFVWRCDIAQKEARQGKWQRENRVRELDKGEILLYQRKIDKCKQKFRGGKLLDFWES